MASNRSHEDDPPRRSNRLNKPDYAFCFPSDTGHVERSTYGDNNADSDYVPSSQDTASAGATPPSSQDSGSTSLSTSNRENRSNAPPPSSQSDDAATPDTASELHIFEDPPSPPPRGRGESASTPRGVNPPLGGLARSPLAPITPRNSRPFAVGSAQGKEKKKKNKEKGKGKEIDVSADHPRTIRTAIENKPSRESNGDGTPCRRSPKHPMMSNLPQCNIYED